MHLRFSKRKPIEPRTKKVAANEGSAGVKRRTAADRRGFFTRLAAVTIGALISLFPLAVGLFVFADPLRRGGPRRGFIKITTLESVPDDDIPRAFSVIATRIDAWTKFPSEPIGAVFLRRRRGQPKPDALQTVCPHLGCMIDYSAAGRIFKCPCHNSAFQPGGELIYGPSPRPMDGLDCEIRDNRGVKEVWVKFESFYTGIARQIVKA